jgi:platelet-activating factor acetylhydrolase IB subunit beta/gamma
MLRSFFTRVAGWLQSRGRSGNAPPSGNRNRGMARLRVESLEERCLPSLTTSVPTLDEIPAIVGLPDVLMASQPKGAPTIVFVGDSISFDYRYGPGAGVWSAFMAPLGAVNYGVPGQTTQSLLYQLSLGQLAGINPFVVVLDIGGNNLLQGTSPQDTADGVLADVATIHQYVPQAQVLVLGVLPGMQSPTDRYRQVGAETNALVSQMLIGDPRATFVDIGSVFVQPDGTISDSIMFDYLHPTALGYLNFTSALWPALQQALQPGSPSIAPIPAPPPSHTVIMSS